MGPSDFKDARWKEYVAGFGAPEGNQFWLGLDKLHALTKTGSWRLKVEIKYDLLPDGEPSHRAGTWGVGEWEKFSVASEDADFRLSVGNRISLTNMGGRHDPLQFSNGEQFATEDRSSKGVNDECATEWGGGWWYSNCFLFCGTCSRALTMIRPIGVWWDGDFWEQLSHSSMWIERVD